MKAAFVRESENKKDSRAATGEKPRDLSISKQKGRVLGGSFEEVINRLKRKRSGFPRKKVQPVACDRNTNNRRSNRASKTENREVDKPMKPSCRLG